MNPKKLLGALVVVVSFLVASCRVTVVPTIKISLLEDNGSDVIPVMVTAQTPECNAKFLNDMVAKFDHVYSVIPVGCVSPTSDPDGTYAVWKTYVPIYRYGDETKIPKAPASIYYSRNNSVIATLNTETLRNATLAVKEFSVDNTEEFSIVFEFKNDTKTEIGIALKSVYVNGAPIGSVMTIYKIRPGGVIQIRLHTTGISNLAEMGVEPVGVVPSIHVEE